MPGTRLSLRGVEADLSPQPISSSYYMGARAVANALFHHMTGVNLGFGVHWKRPKTLSRPATMVPVEAPLDALDTPAHRTQVFLGLFLIHMAGRLRTQSDEEARASLVAALATSSRAKGLVNHPETATKATLLQALIFACDWYAKTSDFYAHPPASGRLSDGYNDTEALADMASVTKALQEAIDLGGAFGGEWEEADVIASSAEVAEAMPRPYQTAIHVVKPAPKYAIFTCKAYEPATGAPKPQDPIPRGNVKVPDHILLEDVLALGDPRSAFILQTSSKKRSYFDVLFSRHQRDREDQALFPMGSRLVNKTKERLARLTESGLPEAARTLVDSLHPQICSLIHERTEAKRAMVTLPKPFRTGKKVVVKANLDPAPSPGSKAHKAAMAMARRLTFDPATRVVWDKETPLCRLLEEGRPRVEEVTMTGAKPGPRTHPLVQGLPVFFKPEELLCLRFLNNYSAKRAAVALAAHATHATPEKGRPAPASEGVEALLRAAEWAPCLRVPSPPKDGVVLTLQDRAVNDEDALAAMDTLALFFSSHKVVTVWDEDKARTMTLIVGREDALDDRGEGDGATGTRTAGEKKKSQELFLVEAFCMHEEDEVTFFSVGPVGEPVRVKARNIRGVSGVPRFPTPEDVRPVDPSFLSLASALVKASADSSSRHSTRSRV